MQSLTTKTAFGEYVGNESKMSIQCGFKPHIVLLSYVYVSTSQSGNISWFSTSDSAIAGDSYGSVGFAITDTGFMVNGTVGDKRFSNSSYRYYYCALKF